MNLVELIDRIGERRLRRVELRQQNPRRPRDIRQFIGFSFLLGYYVMVWRFIDLRASLPEANLSLIRDAMLTLGPPVGLIVGAMFRSDLRDELATENTGAGFRAVTETARAAASANTGPTGNEGDPVHAKLED